MIWPDLQLEHLAGALGACQLAFAVLAWSRSARHTPTGLQSDPAWRWLSGGSVLQVIELVLWITFTQLRFDSWTWWARGILSALACGRGISVGLAGLVWWGALLTQRSRWTVLLVGAFYGFISPEAALPLLAVGWLALVSSFLWGKQSSISGAMRWLMGGLLAAAGLFQSLRLDPTTLLQHQPSELPLEWSQPELVLFLGQGVSQVAICLCLLLSEEWRRHARWLWAAATISLLVMALAWQAAASHRATNAAAWAEEEALARELRPKVITLRGFPEDVSRPAFAAVVSRLEQAERSSAPVRHYWLWSLRDGLVYHLLDTASLKSNPQLLRIPVGHEFRELPNLALRAVSMRRFESGPFYFDGEKRIGRHVPVVTINASLSVAWLQASYRYQDWQELMSDPRVPAAIGLLYLFGLATLLAAIMRWHLDSQLLHTGMAAAEASSKARTLMAGFVSHELRTPLQIILGEVERLDQVAKEGEAARAYTVIADQSRHLLDLVRDTLDLCALEANSMPLRPVRFSPASLIGSLVSAARPSAEANGLDLQYEISPELPGHAIADAPRLRQIVNNLLNNSIRYTPSGSVRLSARATGDNPLYLIIQVTDTGPGLPLHLLQALGTPFQPGEHGGTGLGLALVQRLARRMGGALAAENQENGGCLMTVRIPLSPAVPDLVDPSHPTSHPVSSGGLNGLRVVLAEDNTLLREVIVAHLRHLGAEVAAFGSATDALCACREGSVDAVLLDVMLPGMDGREAARQLSQVATGPADQAGPKLIIGLSAQHLGEEEVRASGFDLFLIKPVSRAELHAALRPLANSPSGNARVPAQSAEGGSSARMRAIFTQEAPEQLRLLRAAMDRGDKPAVLRLSHYLQGSAYALGDESLRSACARLYLWAQGGDLDGAAALARVEEESVRLLRPV